MVKPLSILPGLKSVHGRDEHQERRIDGRTPKQNYRS